MEHRKESPFIRALGLGDVFLMTIAATISPQLAARGARAGASSILLWVLAAAFFLVPHALAVADHLEYGDARRLRCEAPSARWARSRPVNRTLQQPQRTSYPGSIAKRRCGYAFPFPSTCGSPAPLLVALTWRSSAL